jgi:hypothetical protein
MPAECAIDDCGVLAVGRCSACGRAFCTSHRALGAYGAPIIDHCTACQEVASQVAESKEKEVRQAGERAHIRVRELARALTVAGIVPDQKPGWFVGCYSWRFPRAPAFLRDVRFIRG